MRADDYWFFDANTLYIADQRTDANGGIQKWVFDDTDNDTILEWEFKYSVAMGLSSGPTIPRTSSALTAWPAPPTSSVGPCCMPQRLTAAAQPHATRESDRPRHRLRYRANARDLPRQRRLRDGVPRHRDHPRAGEPDGLGRLRPARTPAATPAARVKRARQLFASQARRPAIPAGFLFIRRVPARTRWTLLPAASSALPGARRPATCSTSRCAARRR